MAKGNDQMQTKYERDVTTYSPENLLEGFRPTFEFQPVDPLPEEEFVERLRHIRRAATVAGHDVILVHADSIGSYRTSNSYLRYICD